MAKRKNQKRQHILFPLIATITLIIAILFGFYLLNGSPQTQSPSIGSLSEEEKWKLFQEAEKWREQEAEKVYTEILSLPETEQVAALLRHDVWLTYSNITKEYQHNSINETLFREVEELQDITSRPFTPEQLSAIQKELSALLSHHSTGIEGNTFTLDETHTLLFSQTQEYNLKHTFQEHMEILGHHSAYQRFLEVTRRKSPELKLDDILSFHQLIAIPDPHGGKLREKDVGICGAKLLFPTFFEVPGAMEYLLSWFNHDKTRLLHPILQGALLHYKLVRIHPFEDGNGRVARLLLSLPLVKKGYPPVIIRVEDRVEYLAALEEIHTTRDIGRFVNLVLRGIQRAFLSYQRATSNLPNATPYTPLTKSPFDKLR